MWTGICDAAAVVSGRYRTLVSVWMCPHVLSTYNRAADELVLCLRGLVSALPSQTERLYLREILHLPPLRSHQTLTGSCFKEESFSSQVLNPLVSRLSSLSLSLSDSFSPSQSRDFGKRSKLGIISYMFI